MSGPASVKPRKHDASDGLLYGPLSGVYNLFWRRISRRRWHAAMSQVDLFPGARILEIGVGTGLSLGEYPRDVQVVGVDLSEPMLAHARRKVEREGLHHVTLLRGDAQRLAEEFPPGSFDVVVAAFVLSVVPDPAAVLRGMAHVGGDDCRFVIINHLRSEGRTMRRLEQLVSPITRRLGWRTDLDLESPLRTAGLRVDRAWRLRRRDLWLLVHASKARP